MRLSASEWQSTTPHNTSWSEDSNGSQLNKRDKVFLKSKTSESGKIIDINIVRCNSFPTNMAPVCLYIYQLYLSISQDNSSS